MRRCAASPRAPRRDWSDGSCWNSAFGSKKNGRCDLHPPFLLRLAQVNKFGAQDLAIFYEHSGHGGASGASGVASTAGIEDQAAAYLRFFGYVGVTVDGYVYGSHGQVFAVVGYGEFEAFVGKERKTVYIRAVVAVVVVVS